jgi:hypothetical protein
LLFQRDSKIENLPISLQDYDQVLFIAPIGAARVANPLKTLIKNERDSIRQYSFVTLCGYESSKQKAKLSEQLNRLTGRPPQFVLEMRISDLFPIQDRKKINIISKYHIKPEDFSAYQNEINEIVSTMGSLPPPERGRPRESVSIH